MQAGKSEDRSVFENEFASYYGNHGKKKLIAIKLIFVRGKLFLGCLPTPLLAAGKHLLTSDKIFLPTKLEVEPYFLKF
jgi:hypothetical protein